MGVKERLKSFIKYKNMSIRQFTIALNVSESYVNSISKSIQPDKIERISICFPELNIDWLMTGTGEMIRTSESENKNTNEIIDKRESVPAYVIDMIKQERENNDSMLNKLISQNDALINQQQLLIETMHSELKEIKKIVVRMEENVGCADAEKSVSGM